MSAPSGSILPVRANRDQSVISALDCRPNPPMSSLSPGQNPARLAVIDIAAAPTSIRGAWMPGNPR
ncbi:hypothetical protein AZG88_14325 [Rhodococcus sp. LB1]|nr:hypothetical protein AZG88_14325 [Rhodococcus sp. LB1]